MGIRIHVVIVLFAIIGLVLPVFGQSILYDIPFEGEDIFLEKSIDVNILLVGDTWTSSEITKINNELPTSFEPVIHSTEKKSGIKYNYNYNFLSASEQDSSALFSFMKQNAEEYDLLIHYIIWILLWHPEWIELESDDIWKYQYHYPYKEINAEQMEEYIFNNLIKNDSNLNKQNSVTLVFLKDDFSKIDFLHSYHISQFDKSTDTQHNAVGLMGYGGNYKMYFFDLYAAPWTDIDFELFDFYIPDYAQNLHDCISGSCFADLVSSHVQSALYHIITPSYIYPVNYKSNYIIDLVVYSKPGSSVGLTPQLAKKFINIPEIKAELQNLIPNSKWDIQISIEKRDTRGLTYDFKKALESTSHEVVRDPYGNELTLQYFDSSKLQPYLLSWALERQETQNIESVESWRIPVLLIVDSSQAEVYLDSYGGLGFAPALLNDPDNPCCALGVTDEKNVWTDKLGATDLVLHEVGHVLGLLHPFDSYDDDGNIQRDIFWNWYSSPMTYASPSSAGCGLLYSLVYSGTCGIVSGHFTEFEKEHIANGIMVSMLKTTQDNLAEYEDSDPTDYDATTVNKIKSNINTAKEKIKSGDYFSSAGALYYLVTADSDSKSLLGQETDISIFDVPTEDGLSSTDYGELRVDKKIVEVSRYSDAMIKISGKISDETYFRGQPVFVTITKPDETTMEMRGIVTSDKIFELQIKVDYEFQLGKYTIQGEYMEYDIGQTSFEVVSPGMSEKPSIPQITKERVPGWIKNNAKWWSEGQIGDSDFIGGLQHLIKENIIIVPRQAPVESAGSNEIPDWIKTQTGWWANGQISEDEFLNSIQYLMKEGIIQVN